MFLEKVKLEKFSTECKKSKYFRKQNVCLGARLASALYAHACITFSDGGGCVSCKRLFETLE